MKKLLLAASAAAMAAFGLMACGDEVTNINNQVGIQQVAAGDTLGKCSDKNAGEMVFVTDSAAVYYCGGSEWMPLNNSSNGSVDTLIIRDTLVRLDTLVNLDTIVLDNRDTIVSRDTLVKLDTVVLNHLDTLVILDSLVGLNGKDGENCTFADDGEGSITITCGEGESAKTTTAYKALCGNSPYDPAKKSCLDSRTLCDESTEGVVASAANGGKFTCRSSKWDVASELEAALNKGCVTSIQGERATYGYSNWVCRADSNGWAYDFENINYGTVAYAGQTYKTVGIGDQMWMAENLNYADSVTTPNLKGNSWCFKNDKANCTKYGRLYTWPAALDMSSAYLKKSATADGYPSERRRGICPEGWHVPDTTEFRKLMAFANKYKGDETLAASLKSTDWPDSTKNGITLGVDRFGFGWRLSGFYTNTISNKWSEVHAYFQLSTESRENENFGYHSGVASIWDAVKMAAIYPNAAGLTDSKSYGYSIRCLKD